MKSQMVFATAAVLLGVWSAFAGDNEARPAYGAMLRVPAAGAEFRPRVYVVKGGDWQFREAGGGDRTEKDGTRRFFMRSDNGPKSDVDGVFALSKSADGVVAEWTDAPQANAKVVAGELRGILPLEEYSGGAFAADGQRTEIPSTAPKGGRIGTYRLTRFELFDVHGAKRLELGFPATQTLGVEMSGDPKIGGKLHLCIRMSDAMKPGERYPLRMTLGVPGGLKIGPDANFRIDGGEDWVPFRSESEILAGSALDFSSLRTTGVPAGCHGRVRAVGDHFEFENRPGEALRFYGVNVCTGALTPDTPDDARAFARRLAMSGYNAVRIHHQECWLVSARGKDDPFKGDGVALNPRQMRKFDAFVAACVENGLYMTTDLFCSRTWAIRWRDVGIDRDGLVGMGDFKNLVQVHEGVYSNYLAFARNFLGHRNEFTGRSLAEEPALGWISLVNEGCIGRSTAALEKWPEWRAAWKAWLEGKRRAEPRAYADIPEAFPADVMAASRHACAFKLFLADTESAFAAKMRRFLRDEMKCRALLTNMNGVFHPVHTREARQKNYDYIDGHFYVDHPSFLGQNWKPPSSAGTRNPIGNACGANYPALGRDYSRPFTITEWNYCAPNPNRGCAGLLVGAAAVVQGWGGLWHFDFAGGHEQYTEPEKVGMGSFTMAGDPLMRASDRTAMMLYLRGDMKPADLSFAVEVPERTFRIPTDELPSEDTWHWLNWITWYGRLGASIVPEGGRLPDGLVKVAAYPEDYRQKDYAKVFRTVTGTDADGFPSKTMPPAANGQVRVDGVKGTFIVDTPRTCGGFVPEGAFEAGGLRADVGKVAASVSASSLDLKPLVESDRILVTHLCDCVNTGIVFTDESRRILSQWGEAPQLVRKTKVPVSLAVKSGAWTVWAIDMDGRRMKALPCSWAVGRLSFVCDTAADPRQATFHYELVREAPTVRKANGDFPVFRAGDRVAWIGDSIASNGHRTPSGYINAVRTAAEATGTPGFDNVIGLGFGGWHVYGWHAYERKSLTDPTLPSRFDRVPTMGDVFTNRLDVIVLALGINDHGFPTFPNDDLKIWQDEYDRFISDLKERCRPRRLVICNTTAHTCDPEAAANRRLERMNVLIRELAEKHDAVHVDMHAAIWRTIDRVRQMKTGLRDLQDFIHPRAVGNAAMARQFCLDIGETKMAEWLSGELERRYAAMDARAGDKPRLVCRLRPDRAGNVTGCSCMNYDILWNLNGADRASVGVCVPEGWRTSVIRQTQSNGVIRVCGRPDRLTNRVTVTADLAGRVLEEVIDIPAPWLISPDFAFESAWKDMEWQRKAAPPVDVKEVRGWKVHTQTWDYAGDNDPSAIDLRAVNTGYPNGAAYVRRWLYAPRALKLKLVVGTQFWSACNAVRVWLDGKVVAEMVLRSGWVDGKPYSCDDKTYPIVLERGWHDLTALTANRMFDHYFHIRILDAETGKEPSELRIGCGLAD